MLIEIVDDDVSFNDLIEYVKYEKCSYIKDPDKIILEFKDVIVHVDLKYSLKLIDLLTTLQPYSNQLIFGKNLEEGVVCVEVSDQNLYLIYNDGIIKKEKNLFWILSDKLITPSAKKLKGGQHYKYLYVFSSLNKRNQFYYKYSSRADFFIIWNEKEAAMIYYGITLFKGLKVNDVSVLSFDIESAGLVKNQTSKVFLITNTFKTNKGIITKKHFRVDDYNDNDIDMIKDWCDWVRLIDPDILNGHNIFGYDLPYIQYCCTERDGKQYELLLGRDKSKIYFNKKTSKFRVDGNTEWDYNKCHIWGRHIVDGMFLAVRYDIGRNYPNWGLKSIIQYEGLCKADRQFYDASKIRTNWYIPEEREKIIEYGIHDSDDSLALYELHVPAIFYMTQSVPKPLSLMTQSASGSQLNAMLIRAYIQEGYSIPKASDIARVGGGISFGVPGVYKNVFKIDVASLYPSIIRTLRLFNQEKDPKGYYLQMTDFFTDERFRNKKLFAETKNKYYDDLQASQKIFANSIFGLASTNGLNFNSFDIANTITRTGRSIIKQSILWATNKDLKEWFPEYDETKDQL